MKKPRRYRGDEQPPSGMASRIRRFLKRHTTLVTWLILLAISVIAVVALMPRVAQAPDLDGRRIIEVAGQQVRVDVAETPSERQAGLGGYPALAEGEGMLFVFPDDGVHGFWMKDMKFAIDIVWLDADGKVITIAQNVAPETYPRIYTPRSPARYVIELHAGFAEKYGLKTGNIIKL